MRTEHEIRNIAARLTARRLQKRGVQQRTGRWTVEYSAEFPKSLKTIIDLERPPATNEEIEAFITSKSLATLPLQTRNELRAAIDRRDFQRARLIIARYRDDEGPKEAA